MAERGTARVQLVADWWGESEGELQADMMRALEDIGGRPDGETFTIRLDGAAQRRLRCEAQVIRNRQLLASNAETVTHISTQVRDVRGWVLRTQSDIRRSRSVAHIA